MELFPPASSSFTQVLARVVPSHSPSLSSHVCHLLREPPCPDLKVFPRPPKLPLHQLRGALLNLLIILSIKVLLVLRKREALRVTFTIISPKTCRQSINGQLDSQLKEGGLNLALTLLPPKLPLKWQ